MDIRHLQHILLLAEERNFSRAAERAHLSQPAFSRSIQTAEALAGVKFFDRTQRQVEPTFVGQRVIERGRRILFDANDLDREIRLLESGEAGHLLFGAGVTVSTSVLPRVVTEFHRMHPRVKMQIEVSHWSLLLNDLLDESIDFFIADTSELNQRADLQIDRLPSQRGSFYCRAGHPILDAPLTRERLAACQFAGPQLPGVLRQRFTELINADPKALDSLIVECNSMDILREMVHQTDIILLNLVIAMERELANGLIVDLWSRMPKSLTRGQKFTSDWGIVRLAGRTQSPAAQQFMKAFEVAVLSLTSS